MTTTTTESAELANCPFCNCAMRISSNRDWHRLQGDHDDSCIFIEEDTLVVPATAEQRAVMVADWNRRAAPPSTPAVPEGWMLAPKVPTEAMHIAAVRTLMKCTGNDDFPPQVYRAMLAAAPLPPKDKS